MKRVLSPERTMIALYDLDKPQNQSQRSFIVQSNTIIGDLLNQIKQNIDENYDIQLFLEKDKQFDGSPNTFVMNILKILPTRTFYYKKVLCQKNSSYQLQKSQQYQNEIQINEIKNRNNNINIQQQTTTQGEYQFGKPINNQNQQDQIGITKNQQGYGPTQNNYAKKILIKAEENLTQVSRPQNLTNTQNKQSNAFAADNLKYQSQSQIYSNQIQSQLSFQDPFLLQKEKQQIDQQNQDLKQQVINLNSKIKTYEGTIRDLQNQMEKIKSESQQSIQQFQYNNSKLKEENDKLKDENEKLKNENQRLKNENNTFQRNFIESQAKQQQQIDESKVYYNNQQKLRAQEINPQEKTKEQISLSSSQISQSQYNYQSKVYRNKCGHLIDISYISAQLSQAITSKSKALCNQCILPIQSKLCLLFEYGKQYLETKNSQDLWQLFNNLKRRQFISQEKLVKCSTQSCQFFCIWNQNLRYMQQINGFCPQCLRHTFNYNELSMSMYQTPQQNNYNYNQQQQQQQQWKSFN
ncbi:unnamed protein product [Paramecium octaurelia]|uniref:Uncharacterized protein n=1 Tax=Paramecium octaurelia TaxID=43137 RepID=A0A8S1TI32_PAROT|nr:unnamed protein product [Paramecium octaurelia]